MQSPSPVQPARIALSPGHPVGITEEMIRALVHAFYAKAREDPTLGPIFNAEVQDWELHLAKLCDFWSSVVLMSGRYHGTPMQAHARLSRLRTEHFATWLELFRRTAAEVCPPQASALFIDRAERIAQSLQIGIQVSRGELSPAHARSA